MKTKKYKYFINLTKKNIKLINKKIQKNIEKIKKTRKKKNIKKTKKYIKGGNIKLENTCYNFPLGYNCRWCGSISHITNHCCLN